MAALRAGLHRNAARRYRDLGRVPSELNARRTWRTRENPFVEEDWLAVAQQLAEAPELEAKVLFEDLVSRRPERYHAGQLRTSLPVSMALPRAPLESRLRAGRLATEGLDVEHFDDVEDAGWVAVRRRLRACGRR